ncbi:hypothetical protein [Methylorubrum extorquens]|jgi:hypothetical protein|uniref:Uncharacterized protein n=1 Tax=Methylorubrum extorquens DSM 13060 TaxID=882800 RepID=H1KET0_METEX|nr:hypothetical protein [Methylorubrum extorquens]EHP93921.1 hypothetical protein MetexDRAFT_1142 [Methylorubrum extorquens DSM 13060]MCP1545159.1 hypothetical protein [Methylorubrum extorquens]MCP1587493.1 hypothetical protein [Methylorubrum extorquens]
MKNPALSLWFSSVNGALGWWGGHAANAVRRQQRAALTEMLKTATGTLSKPKRRTRRRRTTAKRKAL